MWVFNSDDKEEMLNPEEKKMTPMQMMNFMTSIIKTAVDARYISPSTDVLVREYLMSNTKPTICATRRNRLPYLIIMFSSFFNSLAE
mmetsp:Transcript_29785/g.43344  ORF Transcript_29785/g.43344 Transcript_29785/m.43344 type:complete len:87 (-) Transcript_29785:171-431(-)